MKSYEGSHLSDFRKLTMNQIQLLRHASSVNQERSDEYYEWKKQFKDEDSPVKVAVKTQGDLTEMPSSMALGLMMPMR